MTSEEEPVRNMNPRNFGLAWFIFSVAFALHIWEEAAHDFIGYYNAKVLTLYSRVSWFPRIDVGFRAWLTAFVLANLLLFALTPLALRGVRWLRPLGYALTGFGLANGIGHVFYTIRGQAVSSARFDGVSPGFYTSLLLLLSATYLFWSLRKGLAPVTRGRGDLTYR
jgi:Protein of unknown function with HXXEE motif